VEVASENVILDSFEDSVTPEDVPDFEGDRRVDQLPRAQPQRFFDSSRATSSV